MQDCPFHPTHTFATFWSDFSCIKSSAVFTETSWMTDNTEALWQEAFPYHINYKLPLWARHHTEGFTSLLANCDNLCFFLMNWFIHSYNHLFIPHMYNEHLVCAKHWARHQGSKQADEQILTWHCAKCSNEKRNLLWESIESTGESGRLLGGWYLFKLRRVGHVWGGL